MTGEEEEVLKGYLLYHEEIENDEEFERWYQHRFDDSESEYHYKQTLHTAQVWNDRFQEGFQQGARAALLGTL